MSGLLLLVSCGSGPGDPVVDNSSSSSSSSASSSSSSSASSTSSSATSSSGILQNSLNDTGIRLCKTAHAFVACAETPTQDGALGRDALASAGLLTKTGAGVAGFDFSKLDKEGNVLAIQNKPWQAGGTESQGTQWSCVRDNHTGLVWEMKHNNPASTSYEHYRYTWRNSNVGNNGGYAGDLGVAGCGPSLCDTESFVNTINQEKLCGISRWRMPKILELMSIVNGARTNLALDLDYFPNAYSAEYWSSQSFAPNNDFAWYIYMSDGSLSSEHKYSKFLVRLVADKNTDITAEQKGVTP